MAWWRSWTLPLTAVAPSLSPLALLLAFRVNAATARFNEARGQWGRAVHHARDAAAMLASSPDVPEAARVRCCRLLCSLGWALKASLRGDPDLNQVLLMLLATEEEATHITSARNAPLALLSSLRRTTASLNVSVPLALRLSESITELGAAYGGMQRIYSTPMSPTYMRHTSRGLCMWLALFASSLVGAVPIAAVLMIVLSTAYVMLGIDEIGIQIEEPFSVLPLSSLAAALSLDVLDACAYPEMSCAVGNTS